MDGAWHAAVVFRKDKAELPKACLSLVHVRLYCPEITLFSNNIY